MKKKFVVALALALCIAIALPVAALADAFVPSVTYKGGPEVETGSSMTDGDGNVIADAETLKGCVIITTVEQARDKVTDISQEDRDLLIEVYEKLKEGEMKLPVDGVIRDLVDISFKYNGCRLLPETHGDKPAGLAQPGVKLTLHLDMYQDVEADSGLKVLTYIGETWEEIEEVVINEDGTLTCVFEDICPVAFVVPEK